ncbi:immunoglobulin HY heavy chain [Labeo rohita]|nr:immunoglobulin HY heavy chain [Labeo rohita]
MVTVSSAQPSAPKSIFAMSQCTSDSEFLTIGCLARGFSPADSLTFKWLDPADKELSDFVQFPAFGRDGDYTKISYLHIRKNNSDPQKPYKCEASNHQGKKEADIIIPYGQKPSVVIYKPDLIDKDRVSLVCEVTSSKLGDVYIMWKVGDEIYIEGTTSAPIHQNNYTSVHSFLTMSEEKYERLKSTITCAVKHANMDHTGSPLQVSTSQNGQKPSVVIYKSDLIDNDRVSLVCEVTSSELGDVYIMWKVGDEPYIEGTTCAPIHQNNYMSVHSFLTMSEEKVHNVIIDTKKWFDGEMVTCTIRDTNNNRDVKQEIHFKKGDGQKPSVFIHKPDRIDKDCVSLVCEVTSSELGDVYIMWKVGDEPYIEGTTSAPIHQNNCTSVHSFLTMSEEKYERLKSTITCAVKHANMDHTGSPLQVSTSQDGQKPSVVIYKSDLIDNDRVSLVCEVTSSELGDVYIMWKVGDETYIEGTACAPIHQKNYTSVHSFLTMSEEKYERLKATITCAVKHANMDHTGSPLQVSTSQNGQKPSVFIYKHDLIDKDRVSLVCEVTSSKLGDVYIMWKVGDEPYIEGTTSAPIHQNNYTSVLSFLTMSEEKVHNVIIDTNKWFDGEMVTCTIRDTNNNRDVKQEIHFKKGDGQKPSVFIHKPDLIDKDRVSLVCEVTSSELGDVYIMWKVGDETYIEGTACAPIHQKNYTSVHSFLTMSEEKVHNVIIDTEKWFDGEIVTCTIRDTNNNRDVKQEIHFKKGDGQKPSVFIYKHDLIDKDRVSLVCEVTSSKLGDVYIMWKVGDEPYIEGTTSAPIHQNNYTSVLSFLTMSEEKVHNVIIDTKKWFDGEMVTCTIRDTNNNRDVKQEIHFKKGDGQKPSVFIHKPDLIDKDRVSLVCEVTSSELGDVYIMWKVGDETYIEGTTCAPIHQKNYTSVHSFLTMSEEKYERLKATITCAVKHANMDHTGSPLQVSTSQNGQKPSVFIHKPDLIDKDRVSLVCEVTSSKVGDVYIMWKVGDEPYIEGTTSAPIHQNNYTSVHSFLTMSEEKVHNVIIDTKKWFDGEMVTCTIRDTNNNRDVKQEIHFKKGDGQKPHIFIHKPDLIDNDRVSLVCEVTSSELGNVYIMWKKWFDGEMVTCTIRDTNNNRDIKQEIHFDKGDGKKPNVTIYKPDSVKDPVSHVCEVTSPKLGDVYIMWKVDEEPYTEGRTSARIYQENAFSVLSILTMTKQEPEDHKTITCAVKHANMNNTESPLQVSTSPSESPEPENGFALHCNKDVLEDDEFRSLWSTATSFIFLFLFSLTYSAVLSFFKVI